MKAQHKAGEGNALARAPERSKLPEPDAPVAVLTLAQVAFGGIAHPPATRLLVSHADATTAERLGLVRRITAPAHSHKTEEGDSP